ncbi:tetratricopeptide repeat protein [Streptomyces sp. NPDC003635]
MRIGGQGEQMRAALLAALAEGAGGEAGRRVLDDLAVVLGLDPGASAQVLAEAAERPGRQEAVRGWGERVAELLGGDERVAVAVKDAMERHAPGSGVAWYDGDHSDFRGGVFLREVVGVQVVVQQSGAAAPEAMASLPPRPGGFTGRSGETEALLQALDPVAEPRSPDHAAVLVAAVSGLGGVGKTALAVESAHLACGKGWFTGGVLFVDLHGYDEEPVTADQALQSLLRALGVPPEQIPATADDRAALYRSVLAERAREHGPVLILADNASSPDQVRPLLPGDTRHRVLVTSRDRLAQLGARLVPLEQLTPQAAYELLDLALRIAAPDDNRVAVDADKAAQLASLCGHLPLALQIAAALLAEDPGMPVAELVDELTESHDRLGHLDDGDRSVRAAFDLSYRRLPTGQARLLRLLALAPGPEVSNEVAAALIGADTPPLRDLKELARAHLVERGSGRGWWRLHDLVRAYGAGVVAGDAGLREEGEAARERVLDLYLRWADAADDRLRWLPGDAEPERFADREQALTWFDGERAGLVGAVSWAREERFADAAVRLAECLAVYVEWRRHFDDGVSVAGVAREAARRAGDHRREAVACNSHGNALEEVGRLEEAIEAHTHARDLCHSNGDRYGEAVAWNNLGLALRNGGRVEDAIRAHTHARDLFQAVGERLCEPMAWNNLGIALQADGQVAEAIKAHIRARDLYQAIGDRHREATAWNNVGIALRKAGRAEEASEAHGRALRIYQEFGDWYRAGTALQNLALVHETGGRLTEARDHLRQAADAYARANAHTEAAKARTWAADLPTAPLVYAPPPRTHR